MRIQLDDNNLHARFAPLTLTRPLGAVRCGILTNTERWELLVPGAEITFATADYLNARFANAFGDLVVNASVIPDRKLALAMLAIDRDGVLVWGDQWLAKRGEAKTRIEFEGDEPLVLRNRWDLFLRNDRAIDIDFQLLTAGRISEKLDESNTLIGSSEYIFIEPGARIRAAVINVENGPVYIGKHAEIMEGSLIRGPLALCEEAVLKMGAKIYGPTTIGPHCKVGGEVTNSVFQEYSNKGHDGFLGNSLIGSWCNLGADTNTSNLKNNYGSVRSWSYETNAYDDSGLIFLGLSMGDHSRSGINTMFNTGTVTGVCCNVFGGDFPPKFIPSFSWGTAEEIYDIDKALRDIDAMMGRRSLQLTPGEKTILRHLCERNKTK